MSEPAAPTAQQVAREAGSAWLADDGSDGISVWVGEHVLAALREAGFQIVRPARVALPLPTLSDRLRVAAGQLPNWHVLLFDAAAELDDFARLRARLKELADADD